MTGHPEPAASSGPTLVCPGCGSPHVEFERGLLFCGTCAETTEIGSDEEPRDD